MVYGVRGVRDGLGAGAEWTQYSAQDREERGFEYR
jgi:hypothetical protein